MCWQWRYIRNWYYQIRYDEIKGTFLQVKQFKELVFSPMKEAGFMAIREGTLLVWEMGCRKVCLEGDSVGVINRINYGNPDLSDNGSILHNIFTCAS